MIIKQHWQSITISLLFAGVGFLIGVQTYPLISSDQKEIGSISISEVVPVNPYNVASDKSNNEDFSHFWNAWTTLDEYFAPADGANVPEDIEKIQSAIAGLAASYHDPYTIFLPKDQADQLKETVRGDFEGIGAVLSDFGGQGIFVADIFDDSPAYYSGLLEGDVIIAVLGVPLVGKSVQEAVSLIRGKVGTDVVLTITRNGAPVRDIKIVRGKVIIPTVSVTTKIKDTVQDKLQKIQDETGNLGGNVASAVTSLIPSWSKEDDTTLYRVVKLTTFAESSAKQIAREIQKFARSEEKALIIDVRDNPGGDLEVAVDIASHFLPKGAVVATVRGAHDGEEFTYTSVGYDTLVGKKDPCIAVVVNGNSASASEILAGALHDHNVASLVGEKTFGKGSVQQLIDLGNIGSLKLTVAHWYTPKGTSISKGGIVPAITPKSSEDTVDDPYLSAALASCGLSQ